LFEKLKAAKVAAKVEFHPQLKNFAPTNVPKAVHGIDAGKIKMVGWWLVLGYRFLVVC